MAAIMNANKRLRALLQQVDSELSLNEISPTDIAEMPGNVRKRAFRNPRAASPMSTVALVEDEDGILRWSYEPPPLTSPRRLRCARSGIDDPNIVHGFQFLDAAPNQIGAKLEELDNRLTPSRGLRRWLAGQPQAFTRPAKPLNRVLLFVHGTFSKSEMYFEEFAATPEGTAFLKAAEGQYDALLTFDHPTLSLNTWMNALELAEQMADVAQHIDVICHSRGGLVVSWWLREAAPPVDNVIFVGSPLAGTNLASPQQLKKALDLLSNYAKALGMLANTAATVVPMMTVAAGLMKVLGAVLWVGVHTPLLDAGVALVPGLASQSLVGNNTELRLLFNQNWTSKYALWAIQSNYEPPPVAIVEPWWKFWAKFRISKSELLDAGADVVFPDKNDLVVDMGSMRQLGVGSTIPANHCLDLSASGLVHHCIYFRQPDAIKFMRSKLNF